MGSSNCLQACRNSMNNGKDDHIIRGSRTQEINKHASKLNTFGLPIHDQYHESNCVRIHAMYICIGTFVLLLSRSLKGILWDRQGSPPSIVIFPPKCCFFYRNAFLIMKLSNITSFREIRALIASQSTFEKINCCVQKFIFLLSYCYLFLV